MAVETAGAGRLPYGRARAGGRGVWRRCLLGRHAVCRPEVSAYGVHELRLFYQEGVAAAEERAASEALDHLPEPKR
jgi:hypothetical protein